MLDAPDKNCITLPDGSCVSTEPCMHTVYSLTVEQIEHRLNIEDLYAEIQDLYSNGEGRLGQLEMEKLVDYIVMELTLPLCPVCELQIYPKAYPGMHKKCRGET